MNINLLIQSHGLASRISFSLIIMLNKYIIGISDMLVLISQETSLTEGPRVWPRLPTGSFKVKVIPLKTYLFTFPFRGDVLGGLRWRLLLLRGRVHDDRGCLHRLGELWLGRVVGPCCGSNTNNTVNQQIVPELDQTYDRSAKCTQWVCVWLRCFHNLYFIFYDKSRE